LKRAAIVVDIGADAVAVVVLYAEEVAGADAVAVTDAVEKSFIINM